MWCWIETNEHTQFEWLRNTESKSRNSWNSTNQHSRFTHTSLKKWLNTILNVSKNLQKKNIRLNICQNISRNIYQIRNKSMKDQQEKMKNLLWLVINTTSRNHKQKNLELCDFAELLLDYIQFNLFRTHKKRRKRKIIFYLLKKL